MTRQNLDRGSAGFFSASDEVLTIDCFLSQGAQLVITEDSSYQWILTDCNGTGPAVDFTTYSVLALTTGASGCDRYYRRTVEKDNSARTYTYSIKIEECGSCEPWAIRTHWVTVPRLAEGYSVVFNVE